MLDKKFRPQHNETILSLQYCTLGKQNDMTAEEWVGRLKIKATECKYKENDRRLKEQFINSISNEVITAEIIKDLWQ